MRLDWITVVLSLFVSALVTNLGVNGQSAYSARRPVRRYSGIDAGQEAYLIHENQRRGAITAQMAWNDDMQMLRGLPPKYFEYFPANPFDAVGVLKPGPAVDAVWATPYYLTEPESMGVPGIPDAVQFETDVWDFMEDEPAEAEAAPADQPQPAPAPNPPRPANGAVRPTGGRQRAGRTGQLLRPEELPAPAEVREQLKQRGPRAF